MIFFDGTYRLKPMNGDPVPIQKWTDAWRIRIIDLAMGQSEVQYLRPRIVVAVQIGVSNPKRSCSESMGKRICRDFDLNPEDILWMEQFADKPDTFFVARFIQRPHMGPGSYDSVAWRPALSNELTAIRSYII